jgi:hypothetical protein
MEVHAHTHTARKKWTHYLWEFLMLFLAVFAGFIAENFREHYVEHKRAINLAESLYSDICSDTATLHTISDFTKNKLEHIDSLIHDLHNAPGDWNDTTISRHIFWLVRFQGFERNRSTFDQLKNSGSLRYFKQDLVKLLNAYDVTALEIKLREDGEYNVLTQRVVPLSMQAINFELVYDYSFHDTSTHKVYVRIGDRDKADYFISEAAGVKIIRTRLKIQYEKLQRQSGEIIDYLKNNYHIK